LALIAQVLDQQPDAALIAACVLGVGGILRMLYALMFESSVAGAPTIERKLWALFARRGKSNSLPAQKATTEVIFAAPTTGEWRQTKELQISAFTESATQPLNRDDK